MQTIHKRNIKKIPFNPVSYFMAQSLKKMPKKGQQSLHIHKFNHLPNPWQVVPNSHHVNVQYNTLLFAAQQQSLQHTLLKHILECQDLNSRVRGITAYEEYEASLRMLQDVHYNLSEQALEKVSSQLCLCIMKIFDGFPYLQTKYAETQRRLILASREYHRELMHGEGHISPQFLQLKRIQYCWILAAQKIRVIGFDRQIKR